MMIGFLKGFLLPLLALFARVAAVITAGSCLAAEPSASNAMSYVVELFTSQGCSSCPPADRLLASIARRPDVVAVSFSVDYWDYIGWKDTLAIPIAAVRQKAYAAQGSGQVYTPEAVINGLADAIGSDRQEIEDAAKSTVGVEGSMTVPMRLSDAGGRLLIEVAAGGGGPAGVFALRVGRSRTVRIGRGENAGRSVTYTNVVRAISRIGEWTGARATFEIPVMAGEDEGYVFLVQRGTVDRPGAILGAAKTAGL